MQNNTTLGSLPFMKSMDDAVSLCEKENDNFYLDAFMLEAWIGTAVLDAAGEYACKKKAKCRRMQSGQAWRRFGELFGHAKKNEFPHIWGSLLRFAEYDDTQSEMLRYSVIPLSFEHQLFGDYIGPNNTEILNRPAEAIALLRRSLERWCEWLDSLIHFETHASWHKLPSKFDPDPEKRELAALGVNQRFFADMDDFSRKWWEWHHGQAAERYKNSPKWQTIGAAMSDQTEKVWNYPEVDTATISLWPLLKRNNWTYCDLMNVVRQIVCRPGFYPLREEKEFASYCINVLGLHKTGSGKTAQNGRPPGYEVAMRLCTKSDKSS